MKTFTIHFSGLIAFVSPEADLQHAVLLASPACKPYLAVNGADLIEVKGFAQDAGGRFCLDGESLAIEGIQPAPDLRDATAPDRSFRSPLETKSSSNLAPAISRRQPHPSVAAYVDLRSGELSTASSAGFGNDNPMGLYIPNTVFFRAAAADEVTLRAASGKTIRVRGEAVLSITNEGPSSPSSDEGTSHFLLYAALDPRRNRT